MPLSQQGLGGGAASLFRHNVVPTGPDIMYDYFFSSGATGINCNANNAQTFSGSAGQIGGTHNGLDSHLDHSQQKIWSGYSTASSYGWSNGGGNYTGNANFYAISSGQSDIAGATTSGLSGNGRGFTIAVLPDNTPVIIISNTSDRHFYFFNYPSGTWIGRQSTNTGSNQPTGNDWSGLAWDGGNHLLVANRSDNYVWAYSLPSSTSTISTSSPISTVAKWSVAHACQYGMVYGGGNRLYLTDRTATSYVTQFLLSGTASQVGQGGSSNAVTTYDLSSTNYSLMMDYKNRKLIIGGYSNSQYLVVGE